MFRRSSVYAFATLMLASTVVFAADKPSPKTKKPATDETLPAPAAAAKQPDPGTVQDVETSGSVAGIAYRAVAGTLTVAGDDGHDAQIDLDGKWLPEAGVKLDKPEENPPTARIFYAAYFRKDAKGPRPVTFFYNGGPGSASLWLHMGSFGPKHVVVQDTEHLPSAAPYQLIDNASTLLDVSDLVFIDAPGTGFSRLFGKEKEKAFWGTDQDTHAFERFIRRFLTKYDRWNSPKYLFGESYGTTRSATLAAALQNVDLNGVILLSQVLNFDDGPDGPRFNPGVDYPYIFALPTYAMTAAYHHKLSTQPTDLDAFRHEVEGFATGEYAAALMKGTDISENERNAVATKLHDYTGIPVATILKSDLRLSGAFFTKNVRDDEGKTVGRFDTRFVGPDMRRISEEAEYDPQDVAISGAYVAAGNAYLRSDLKFGRDMTYLPGAYTEPGFTWDLRHGVPGGPPAQFTTSVNVMTDLAVAMKGNPRMKVLLLGGYYDLATPYFAATYEMKHLPIPQSLAGNIQYHFYPAGHMIYVNPDVLKQAHDDVAAFIKSTEGGRRSAF